MSRLVLVSKSPASPAIRREHALAALASDHDIEVVFVEPPSDVRAAARRPDRWARELVRPRVGEGRFGSVVSPAVLVPGHRGGVALAAATWSLRRTLRALVRPGDVVVAMTPWDWPAIEGLPGVRRVFECADDWPALIPGRAAGLQALLGRAASAADAVIVASPKLAGLFAGRSVEVVRNAAGSECLETAPSARPHGRRAIYLGTLSERVDLSLLEESLRQVPGLQIELVGPSAFAGLGSAPSPELERALGRHAPRLLWRGPVPREDVPASIDAADVGLLPFVPALARGDIMKVYDYAARGRPIVSAAGVVDPQLGRVPGLTEAATPADFARAVEAAFATSAATLADARRFAESNDWAARWPRWRQALFGPTAR